MSVVIACDQCGRQYNAADGLVGQRVKCAQCGATFLAQATVTPGPAAPNFTSGNAASGAGAPAPNPYQSFSQPSWPQPSGSPASSGPTDKQFRIGAAVLIPIISLGMLASLFAMFEMKDISMAVLVVVGLGPFAIFYGIAALIDPNIVRAAGKFGTHLPARYKLIAFGVGLAALLCSLTLAYVVWSRLNPG